MSQSNGEGGSVYMYVGRVTQIAKLEGGLKIEIIPRQHCVCVRASTWLLEKELPVRKTVPLGGSERGVKKCSKIMS